MGTPTEADQMCLTQAEFHISSKLFDFEVQHNAVPIVRRNCLYRLGEENEKERYNIIREV